MTDFTLPDGLPDAPGLAFRRIRMPDDFAAMAQIAAASFSVDDVDLLCNEEDIARDLRHPGNMDPARDILMATIDDELVGWGRTHWKDETEGPVVHGLVAALDPARRSTGLRDTLFDWAAERAREVAAGMSGDEHAWSCWIADTETHLEQMLRDREFAVIRTFLEEERDLAEPIPELPLPDRLELRRCTADDARTVWLADCEASRDHWGFSEPNEDHFRAWTEAPRFQPQRWMVAWDGAEPAGWILNYIDEEENRKYDRKRGYTEDIAVARQWRRQGVARGLLARSLKLLRDEGMTVASLGVDSENLTGARRVYEGLGFRRIKEYRIWRKPFTPA